jgi:hypothetical protein
MGRTITTIRLLDRLDSAIGRLVKVAERTAALAQRDGVITERQADQREAAELEVSRLVADMRERLTETERQAETRAAIAQSMTKVDRNRRKPASAPRR